MTGHSDDGLAELRAALRSDVAAVAEALLGAPSKAHSTKNTLRWGGQGSMAVEIRGTKRGFWFSHEAGQGSDLLGLIRRVNGCNFVDALAWARNWTGLGAEERANAPPPPPLPHDQAEDTEAGAERATKIATAKRIADRAVPLAGTLGEYYLKQVRGISMPPEGWSPSILWHPGSHAVLAVATTSDGIVQAVQRIHLAQDGGKIQPEEVARRRLRAVKVTNGQQDGTAVRLPGDPAGPLLLAEGPETGLAVYASTGHETWIALGGVGKLRPPVGRRVVVIADDNPPAHDARFGQAAKTLRSAVTMWREAGVDVVVATPWSVRRRDKSDMADLILAYGAAEVRNRVKAALEPVSATAVRLPTAQARQGVGVVVAAFFAKVDGISAAMAEWDKQANAAMSASMLGQFAQMAGC